MNNYDREARKGIEKSILATIITYSNSNEIKEVVMNKEIQSSYFMNSFYQEVYQNVESLMLNGQVPTIEALGINRSDRYRESFTDDSTEGELYLMYISDLLQITNYATSKARFDTDLLYLKEFVIIDYWNNQADNILNSHWNNRDIFEVSENIVNGYHDLLKRLLNDNKLEQDENLETIKEKAMKKFIERQNGIDNTIKIGNKSVDEHMGGMAGSELIVVGGRPGMGKTAFALAIAKNASLILGKKGLYFTLEMTKEQLMMKYASKPLQTPYRDLKAYKIPQDKFAELMNFYDYIESSPLEIVFENNLEKIIEETKRFRPDYVIIDYIQLIKTNHRTQSREQEVAHISNELKSLSTALNIPVIALAQLKRIVGRPDLTALRESGAIEQDADVVIFPYRPAYDQTEVFDWTAGCVEFIIPKCRSAGPANLKGYIDLTGYQFYDDYPYDFEQYKTLILGQQQKV